MWRLRPSELNGSEGLRAIYQIVRFAVYHCANFPSRLVRTLASNRTETHEKRFIYFLSLQQRCPSIALVKQNNYLLPLVSLFTEDKAKKSYKMHHKLSCWFSSLVERCIWPWKSSFDGVQLSALMLLINVSIARISHWCMAKTIINFKHQSLFGWKLPS